GKRKIKRERENPKFGNIFSHRLPKELLPTRPSQQNAQWKKGNKMKTKISKTTKQRIVVCDNCGKIPPKAPPEVEYSANQGRMFWYMVKDSVYRYATCFLNGEGQICLRCLGEALDRDILLSDFNMKM